MGLVGEYVLGPSYIGRLFAWCTRWERGLGVGCHELTAGLAVLPEFAAYVDDAAAEVSGSLFLFLVHSFFSPFTEKR